MADKINLDKVNKADVKTGKPAMAAKPHVTPAPVDATAAKPVAAKTVATPPAKPAVAKASAPKVEAVKVNAPKVAAPAPMTAAAPVAAAAPATQVATPVAAPVAAPITLTPTPEPTPAVASAPVISTTQKEESIMENTIKTATDKAQTLFVDMNDRAKAAMEKTQGLFADMNEFNKGNVEALVESSKIAVKGIESMGQEAAEYTRKSFEGMTAVIKNLGTVKSPTEFMKLHSDYVRTSFDSLVAESSKNTEAMLKLAGEIAQPISNRVAVAAEKMKISA